MSQITPEVVTDCIMEGMRRRLQVLRAPKPSKPPIKVRPKGQPPLGYSLENGEWVPNPAERDAMALARKLRDQGLTLRQVSAMLDGYGYRSRRGNPYAPSTILVLLTRGTNG